MNFPFRFNMIVPYHIFQEMTEDSTVLISTAEVYHRDLPENDLGTMRITGYGFLNGIIGCAEAKDVFIVSISGNDNI